MWSNPNRRPAVQRYFPVSEYSLAKVTNWILTEMLELNGTRPEPEDKTLEIENRSGQSYVGSAMIN